jgi:hypothetical protein
MSSKAAARGQGSIYPKNKKNTPKRPKEISMLNRVYDAVEEVLESLDAGGEQSRAFADEIRTLKKILGYPPQSQDCGDAAGRRELIGRKLHRLAIEAEGLTASVPTLNLKDWLDGPSEDSTAHVAREEYDLAMLLRFIANTCLSHKS